jgi:SAM-dependent methyltransferase
MQTKETRVNGWGIAPHDWATLVEPKLIPLYKAALQRLQADKKTVLLDAGCGSGLFLSMASASGTKIFGTDAAPGLLELTKKRLPEGTFLLEDLSDITFCESSFDVVTAFNSLQYAPEPMAALLQFKKLLRGGGKLVIGLWDDVKHCEAGTIFSALASWLVPPPPHTPGPFALSSEGTLEQMARECKLSLLHKERIHCPWLFTSREDLFKAFLCTPPGIKAIGPLGEKKVKEIIDLKSMPYCLADEIYFMHNYCHLFILQKQGR